MTNNNPLKGIFYSLSFRINFLLVVSLLLIFTYFGLSQRSFYSDYLWSQSKVIASSYRTIFEDQVKNSVIIGDPKEINDLFQKVQNSFIKETNLVQFSVFTEYNTNYFFSTTKSYEGKTLNLKLKEMADKTLISKANSKIFNINIAGQSISVVQFLYKIKIPIENSLESSNSFATIQLLFNADLIQEPYQKSLFSLFYGSVIGLFVSLFIVNFFGLTPFSSAIKKLYTYLAELKSGNSNYISPLLKEKTSEAHVLANKIKELTLLANIYNSSAPDSQVEDISLVHKNYLQVFYFHKNTRNKVKKYFLTDLINGCIRILNSYEMDTYIQNDDFLTFDLEKISSNEKLHQLIDELIQYCETVSNKVEYSIFIHQEENMEIEEITQKMQKVQKELSQDDNNIKVFYSLNYMNDSKVPKNQFLSKSIESKGISQIFFPVSEDEIEETKEEEKPKKLVKKENSQKEAPVSKLNLEDNHSMDDLSSMLEETLVPFEEED